MKHTLKALLLTLLPLLSLGQKVTGTVDLSNYPTWAEMHKAIADARLGTPTVPEIPACEQGPAVISITKITSTSANVTWHGLNVTRLDWRVVSSLDTTKVHAFGTHDPSGNQFPISYAGLAPGQYKLLLDGVLCKGHGSRNFTVPTPAIPIANCPRGPDILEVSGVTAFGVTVKFDGLGVSKLVVDTKDASGKLIQADTTNPLSSTLIIRYAKKLSPGNYLIRTSGVSCKGGDPEYKIFTVNEEAGGGGAVVPPVTGEYAPTNIMKGHPDHLKLDWKRDGDSYLITDLSNPDQIGSGYEYRYMVGSEIIKTGKGLLKNYRVSGFNPVRIVKYKVKPHLTLANWTSKQEEVGHSSFLDAGEGFSMNTSIAAETYAFPGLQGDFVNPIPANYDPSTQNVQWGDIAQDMQLPKGHIWIANPKPWTILHALKKGVTHIGNASLDWSEGPPYRNLIAMRKQGITYSEVERIETVLNLTKIGNTGERWGNGVSKDWWSSPTPSYNEGYEKGLRADVSHAIRISEMTENDSFLPPDIEYWRGFYDAYMPRMEQEFGSRGIPYLVCHDYLVLGVQSLGSGKAQALKVLSQKPNEFQGRYSPDGVLGKTNLLVETGYLNAPDQYGAYLYELMFRMELYTKMGYAPGTFMFGVHEWRPNNLYEINYPEGKMYVQDKPVLDPNVHIGMGFVSQVFGKLFLEWGASSKVEKKTIPADWDSGKYWFPHGSASPQGGFPYFKKGSDKDNYYGYKGATDLSYFSQKLFNDTYAKVEGGTDKYLRFRVDGGAWISPTDKDYIEAYYSKRGFVHSRSKDGKIAFFYLNSFIDNAYHKLEVELPNGQIWSGKVSGNGIHAKLL
jgi:hypothetical protein